MSTDLKPALSLSEAAELLGIHKIAVRRLIAEGRLNAVNLGKADAKAKRLVIRRSEIDAFLEREETAGI